MFVKVRGKTKLKELLKKQKWFKYLREILLYSNAVNKGLGQMGWGKMTRVKHEDLIYVVYGNNFML
jgi:hypothetical protein